MFSLKNCTIDNPRVGVMLETFNGGVTSVKDVELTAESQMAKKFLGTFWRCCVIRE